MRQQMLTGDCTSVRFSFAFLRDYECYQDVTTVRSRVDYPALRCNDSWFKEFQLTKPARAITMRGLRILWVILIMITAICVRITETAHAKDRQISQMFYTSIGIVSIWLIGTIFFLQMRSSKQLKSSDNAADPRNTRRSYAIQLLLMSCSLAVVLYGVVVRFAGATLAQTLPFYVVGSLLLLYFKPKQIGIAAK